MVTLLTIVHVLVCAFLILVVLLQRGKGQDFASTFGGGGTQATFGSRSGTTILHKLTTIAAALFMVTSLTLTIMASRSTSVLTPGAIESQTAPPPGQPAAPVAPVTPTPEETAPPAVPPAAAEDDAEPEANQ